MRFFPGPQGPCVRKICFWCGPASAPEFAEPTLPVQIAFPLQGGRWHGEAVTDEGGFLKRAPYWFPVDCRGGPVCPPRSYRAPSHQGAHIGAPLRAFRQFPAKTGAAFGRPQAFPFRGRCRAYARRMRGTAPVIRAVRFPRAAEGGGPYGKIRPLFGFRPRAAARAAPVFDRTDRGRFFHSFSRDCGK